MTPERYRRIGELYHEALALERERREPFLQEACAGDTALMEEVASLIAEHEDDPDFLAALVDRTTVINEPVDTDAPPRTRVCRRCGARYPNTVVLCTNDGEVLDTDPEALVGVTLDGIYRVEELIGKGGMGVIYRARHLLLDDVVAIKMMSAEAGSSPGWLRRFQREGRAARRFRHPNAVTVHELRIAPDGTTYMVLEYVDGPTLRTEMRRRAALPADEALAILGQIADALDAAHAAGVVHRDVKPENVMLAGPVGGPRVVKLLDLGIAKFLGAGDAAGPLTAAGEIIGTPAYMSPEQWGEPQRDGHLDVDGRTDVYSVGVLAYELFAGRLPFAAGSREAWRRHHVATAPPPIDPARLVPSGVEAAIRRAMSKDRADRHLSTGAFVAEIRAVLGGADAWSGAIPAAVAGTRGSTAWGAATTEIVDGETVSISTPNNLPAEPTAFVGRAGQVDQVERMLAPGRLVTLVGMGGIGKTRLALRVARTALASRQDEAWFVELAPLSDPSLVADTIARAAGVGQVPGAEQLDVLCEAMASRNALVVLDNCEHLLAECRRVAGALLGACPGLRMLATSRAPLGLGGEVVWRVPALDTGETGVAQSDAARLFVERAIAARPSFVVTETNAPAVAELCRRLEGIPLAIELAAARVKVLSVEQIAARMADRFTLLRGGPADAPARQRALRAAIDWSCDLLAEPERILLGRVSVFAGGWTIDAAEGVCAGNGIEVDDVLDLLVGLVDQCFVGVTEKGSETRYSMSETLRQYAAERLAEVEGQREVARLARRHRDWYLQLAQRAAGVPAAGRGASFERLETEIDNVRAALGACLAEEGDADAALVAVTSLDPFWRARGYTSEGLGWIEAALERALDAPAAVRATALRSGGYLANLMEDGVRAAALLEESVRLARIAGDPAILAASLKSLATAVTSLRDFDRAEALARESLSLCLAAGDPKSIAAAKDRLASVAWHRDDIETARSLWGECLSCFREMDDGLNIAVILFNLARVERVAGDAEAHASSAGESAARFRELGFEAMHAHALVEMGLAAASRGDFLSAVDLEEKALELSRAVDDRLWVLPALEAVACIAAGRGETQRALRLAAYVEETNSRLNAIEPGSSVAWTGRQIGPARADAGEVEAARLEAEGRAMTVERATDYALETLRAVRLVTG